MLALVREALHAPSARDRGLFDPARVESMLTSPNEHRTNLDGSALAQIGLLVLWLQHHRRRLFRGRRHAQPGCVPLLTSRA